MGTPFLPSDIPELLVWMDASELTLADDDPVTTWAARAGSGVTVSIVGTPEPVFKAAAQNGNGVVRFEAGEGRVRGTMADTGTTYTVFGVSRLTSASLGRMFSSVYTPRNWLMGSHGSTGYHAAFAGGFLISDITYSTAWRMFGFVQDGSAADFTVDGVVKASGSSSDYLGDQFAFSGYSLTGTEETTPCEIAEFIVFGEPIAELVRQKVEGYLAHKWGIEGNLPGDHPFKAAPPENLALSGVTRDADGAPLGGCTVKVFRTSDDLLVAETTSDGDGAYQVDIPTGDELYAVAYKAGTPDLTGATVNTLVGE